MKKNILYIIITILVLLGTNHSAKTQIDSNMLVAIHNITTTEMNTQTATAITGSLVHNTKEGSSDLVRFGAANESSFIIKL